MPSKTKKTEFPSKLETKNQIMLGSEQRAEEEFAILMYGIKSKNYNVVNTSLDHDKKFSFFNETQRLELLDIIASGNVDSEIFQYLERYFVISETGDKKEKNEISQYIHAMKMQRVALPSDVETTLKLLNQVCHPSDRDLLKFLLSAQDTFDKTPLRQAVKLKCKSGINATNIIISHIKSVNPDAEHLKAMGVMLAPLDAIKYGNDQQFSVVLQAFKEFIICEKMQNAPNVARKDNYRRPASRLEKNLANQNNRRNKRHQLQGTYSILGSWLDIANRQRPINNDYGFKMPIADNNVVSVESSAEMLSAIPSGFQKSIADSPTVPVNDDTLDRFGETAPSPI